MDINDGQFYELYIIASNRPLNQTQIDKWNGARLDCHIHIVDIDIHKPFFIRPATDGMQFSINKVVSTAITTCVAYRSTLGKLSISMRQILLLLMSWKKLICKW